MSAKVMVRNAALLSNRYSSARECHTLPVMPFTTKERDLLRRELCRHFGEDPRIADGIFLRTWRGGERKGEPKIPPAAQTMLDRGLVEIRPARFGARAFFTEAGLRELRELVRDRRAMDPERFGHLRRELGIDPVESDVSDTSAIRSVIK
jgi:hypothetical protein